MINWLKWRWLYFTISLCFLVPGIFSLVRFGLEPSIDFAGGTLWEVQVTSGIELTTELVDSVNEDFFSVNSVQSSGQNRYIIRGSELALEDKATLEALLIENVGEIQEVRYEQVGPTISKELLLKTVAAVVLVSGIITLYVWYQFSELRYGISAILAMFHDSLILLGSFSLLGWQLGVEVDVLFVTALLTTLSFSVHDTIVVYDRIRELRTKHPSIDLQTLINTAVTETLSRSLNNSITIIIMLVSLVLFGGATIRWFAVALLIGAVTGTYSSTFTAAPLLMVWEDVSTWAKKRKQR